MNLTRFRHYKKMCLIFCLLLLAVVPLSAQNQEIDDLPPQN